MEKKEKKPKKPHTRKFYVRLLCLFVAAMTLLSFYVTTVFAGDRSLIYFISNYEITSPVPQNPNVTFDKSNEEYSVINYTGEGSLKILQLTDLHIGCGIFTMNTDKMAVTEVIKAVTTVKPDFIVVTGDALSPIYIRSGTENNYNELDAFIALMEKFSIPWAFVFGNHDDEGLASKEYISSRLEKAEHCLFKRGDKNIAGAGNYYVKLNFNGEFRSAVFLMDTGAGNFMGYEGVHDDQIEWYESKVNELKTENQGFKSMLFVHIPLPEYNDAWDLYSAGSDMVEKFYGDNHESVSPGAQRGFYDKIAELNTTKWIFCGHDHENNCSILMKETGIRLTFGMSIDYSAYLMTRYKTEHRGATLIEINETSEVTVRRAPQDNGYMPVD